MQVEQVRSDPLTLTEKILVTHAADFDHQA